MTTLPAAGYFSGAITNAQAKQAQDDTLAVIRELEGGETESTLTIATGLVTPTRAVHSIDTEAAASTDDLANIAQTNHTDGRLLIIRCANNARNVVVKHLAGGTGQINLAGAVDTTLADTTQWLLLKRTGSAWDEIGRFYGNQKQSARSFFGFTTAAGDADNLLQVNAGGTGFEQIGPNKTFRNQLLNGAFSFWQRGISFTATGYSADRWRFVLGTSATVTTSRQAHTLGQTDVPGEPTYYIRMNRSVTGSTASSVEQRIESVRTLAAKKVTFSFYAKGSSSFTLNYLIRQNFGTGGAPSANVDTATQNASITTAWQRFTYTVTLGSISGKTLGTDNNDYLSCLLELPTAAANVSVDISDAQIEEGPIATKFERRPLAVELAACLRFYEKSYELTVNPGTANNTGSIGFRAVTSHIQYVPFTVTKRAQPTIALYSPSDGAATNWRDVTAAANLGVTVDVLGTSGVTIFLTAPTSGNHFRGHWTADAEL